MDQKLSFWKWRRGEKIPNPLVEKANNQQHLTENDFTFVSYEMC